MKRILINKSKVTVMFLILGYQSKIYASLPTVEMYYKHGETTTEYIVDKDDDLDYSFNKYYIRADEELNNRLSFILNYVDYNREYKEETDINNKIRDYKNAWDYYFYKDKDSSLKLDLNLAYRTKRYDNKETLDFNRTKVNSQLTWVDEGNWRITVRGGADFYNFINSEIKNKDLYYEKLTVKKYFNDEKLVIINGVKLKQTELTQKRKNEYEIDAGVDIKTDYNLLEKISLRGEIGERNTVEDEEYEEEELNYDYRYTLVKVKTVHQLTERIETSLKGEIKDKNYEEVDYDYKTYIAGNDWKWKYYLSGKKERKRYIQAGLNLVHANTKYEGLTDSSHYKNGAVIELAYKMWGRWSYDLEFGAAQYRYELEDKDRDVYHAGTVLTRKFFHNRLEINLEYNYRIKDYLSSDRRNVYQNSFLIGGVWKW